MLETTMTYWQPETGNREFFSPPLGGRGVPGNLPLPIFAAIVELLKS
jgi:hypothetical protein